MLPPISWGEPDTIETAHRMLDGAQAAVTHRSDGTECRVAGLHFDSIGVGQGVESALAHAFRDGLYTAAVNVGLPASDKRWPDRMTSKEKFVNIKAEAWWLTRERFKSTHEMELFLLGKDGGQEHPLDELIVLPGDDAGPDAMQLAAQLSMPKWTRNEKGKILIEPKAQLARRGIASPDHAEALILTFVNARAGLENWLGAFGLS